MILGIDVGNTDIVAALIDERGVNQNLRYETKKRETAPYHAGNLKQLVGNQAIDGIIISCVVPEINEYLEQACVETVGKIPMFVSAKLKTKLDIKYDAPNKLGADLITGAVGAVKKYGTPAIIIDIGTATTFAVISKQNEYLGGIIAPGPYTSMKALAAMTSLLPETDLTVTDKVIGTNTADCIRIGTLTAHAAMIDGMIDRIRDKLNIPDAKIIATGGISKDITDMCTQHEIICDRNLLFDGLYELYKMNI
jgi:type III pantothenate kinase